MFKQKIKINDEEYTLTANRRILLTIKKIAPELLQIRDEKELSDKATDSGINLIANVDILFYDMIKVEHPTLSKQDSDNLLDKLSMEYGDAELATELVNFAMSSFMQGGQNGKNVKDMWVK